MVLGSGEDASSVTERKWYAIHVMSRHERKVAEKLRSRGLEVFLPEYRSRSRRKDRVKMILRPLFPGYLFVRTSLAPKQRLKIIQTPSVVRIVGINTKPHPIPDEQVESVRLLIGSTSDAKPEQNLRTGQKVMVTDGPLKGVVGVVEKTPRGEKIVVCVELLNRAVSASLQKASVSPFLDS